MEREHYSPSDQGGVDPTERPFALVPDPRYFYRSASHGSVFDQLHEAVRRRAGHVLLTGEVGSGKTTVCLAVLAQVDRKTFISLVLDIPKSDEDLLRTMLQDFGLVSRDEMKRGQLAHASTRELLATLQDFLTSLRSLGASALLVIDEAQDVPLEILDQISALAGAAGGNEKVLQMMLVGQPILRELLSAPAVRELDGKVTSRLELRPLAAQETSEYVAHRLTVAGAGPAVEFAPAALSSVHRYSGGVPRLINMLCDGAMTLATGDGHSRVTPEVVDQAAGKLELRPTHRPSSSAWIRQPAVLVAAGLILATSIAAAYVSLGDADGDAASRAPERREASTEAAPTTAAPVNAPTAPPAASKQLAPLSGTGATATSSGTFSVLVASFRQADEATALLIELRQLGLPVREIRVVQSPRGVWHQVLVGPYPDAEAALRGQERVRQIRAYADAQVVPG